MDFQPTNFESLFSWCVLSLTLFNLQGTLVATAATSLRFRRRASPSGENYAPLLRRSSSPLSIASLDCSRGVRKFLKACTDLNGQCSTLPARPSDLIPGQADFKITIHIPHCQPLFIPFFAFFQKHPYTLFLRFLRTLQALSAPAFVPLPTAHANPRPANISSLLPHCQVYCFDRFYFFKILLIFSQLIVWECAFLLHVFYQVRIGLSL